MKTVLSFLSFTMITLPLHLAMAGPGVSGGGNAVVCFPDSTIPDQIRNQSGTEYGDLTDAMISQITSVEVLDLYEAKLKQGISGSAGEDIYPLKSKASPLDYVHSIENRFKQFPLALISDSEKVFPDDHIVMEPHGLAKIMDADMVGLTGPNCVLATLAAQMNIDGDWKLYIDQRLYQNAHHPSLSRSILLLHEFVYRYFREKGDSNSQRARNLVKMLIQNHGLTRAHVVAELKALGIIDPKTSIFKDQIAREDYVFNSIYSFLFLLIDENAQYMNQTFEQQMTDVFTAASQELASRDIVQAISSCNTLGTCLAAFDMPLGVCTSDTSNPFFYNYCNGLNPPFYTSKGNPNSIYSRLAKASEAHFNYIAAQTKAVWLEDYNGFYGENVRNEGINQDTWMSLVNMYNLQEVVGGYANILEGGTITFSNKEAFNKVFTDEAEKAVNMDAYNALMVPSLD